MGSSLPVAGFKPVCQPVPDRCAAAARWRRRPRTRSAWPPGSSGARGGRCRCRRRRARAPWCARRGGPASAAQNAAVLHVELGGKVLGQPPCRLRHGQPQALDVDVAVGQPGRDRLEAADRPVELLAFARVLRGQLQRPLEHAELKCAAAQGGMRGQPRDDLAHPPTTRSAPSSTPWQFEVPDAAVAGGVQRGDRHARVVLGDHENLGARIGLGGNQESVGDRPVEHLGAGAGQPVAVAVGRAPGRDPRPCRRRARR